MWIKHLLLAALIVFLPVKSVVICTLVLTLCDCLLGVWAAHRRGERITSSGLRRTITKVAVYELAIVLSFLIQQYMSEIPVCKIASTFIGVVELKSMLENLDDIYGQPVFASLIKKLGSDNDSHS